MACSSAPIISDGSLAGLVVVFRDVTRQKQAQQELRESERHYRALADSMPQIVWAARPDGALDYYNRRWYEFTGLPEGQIGDASWTPIVHPDDLPTTMDSWYAAVRSGDPFQIECRFKDRATGGYRWHLGRASPSATTPAESRAGSARVRTSTTRSVWSKDCARPTPPRTSSWRCWPTSCATRWRRCSAPCTSRSGRRDPSGPRGVSGPDGTSAPPAQPHGGRPAGGVARGVRPGAARPERLDLARLVRAVVEDRRPLLERAGVGLTLAAPATPLWVQGDPDRLAQVLDNLLDNETRFVDRGGRVDVGLTADRCADEAVLTLTDDGIGIAPEMLDRLFDVFAQADQSLDRKRGGLGLGLAVVKGLVEQHGGTVQAASEGLGKGAVFTMRLPLEPEPAALSLAAEAPRPRRRPARVLVIEDNHDAAESLRMLLEILGHEVRWPSTARRG